MQAIQRPIFCQVDFAICVNFSLMQPFPRYYTGFSPVFSRYNGENGLVGGMKVWECKAKDGLEDYLKATRTCNRVMPQCQVGFCLLVLISIFSTEAALLMGSRRWG